MAERTAKIILAGSIDSTFNELGSALSGLGSEVNQISEQLLNFGKESLDVYKSYEYNMKQLEATWGSNGTFKTGSVEFKEALKGMNQMAAEWAANTIFHTSDISNAFVIAAHAGWDYEQMLGGMPTVMRMAQAGDMDLSTSLDYVLKSMMALGIEYQELPGWVDKWIYASNRSAGTAREFGDTFLRMGATMRFTENPDELLALTALMADMGTTGSEAGTLIRTSLLRILAPSGAAEKALEGLGATAEEVEAVASDASMRQAMELLNASGFSAFDETGQAKSALQIYSDLGEALAGIAGGYENITKNEDALGILNSIFGTRGITGALNIIQSLEKAKGLYEELQGGAAEGTGEYVQSVVMDSLYGDMEMLASKLEELQRRVGEGLSEGWGQVLSSVGEIVDKVNSMDDTQFGAILDGLTALAVAGPGLIIAGGAMSLIGKLLSPAGAIGMGAVALASVAASLESIKEAQFEGNWGNMELDAGEVGKYIESLGEPFNRAFENVHKFNEELQASVDKYKELTGHFSSDLMTQLLTKKDFTPEDRAKFEQYGIDIYETVLGSITTAGEKASEFWNAIFGGDEASAADPRYQNIIAMLEKGSQANIEQAQGIAEKIRSALMSGFEEGFGDEDYQTILSYFEEYNQLVARAQAQAATEEQFIAQELMLHKAQTASYEEIKGLAQTAAQQRDSDLGELETNFQTERARLKYYAIQSGMTPEQAEAYVASTGVDKQYETWRSQYEANYDEFLTTLWNTQARQSGLGEAYEQLGNYADMFLGGQMSTDLILAQMAREMGNSRYQTGSIFDSDTNERANLGKLMGNMIASMGGEQAVAERAKYYSENGNAEMAGRLQRLLAMEQLVNEFASVEMTDNPVWDFFGMTPDFRTSAQDAGDDYGQYKKQIYERNRAMMEAMVSGPGYTTEFARETIAQAGGGLAELFEYIGEAARGQTTQSGAPDLTAEGQIQLDTMRQMMALTYDLPKVYGEMVKNGMPEDPFNSEYLAMWSLMFGEHAKTAEEYLRTPREGAETGEVTVPGIVEPQLSEEAAQAAGEDYTITIPGVVQLDPIDGEVTGAVDAGQKTADKKGPMGVGVEVKGAETAAQAAYSAMQQYANNHPIRYPAETETSGGSGGAGSGGAAGLGGGEGSSSMPLMAEGGRATEAVVFGEAGPEWFIPEAKTPRTADLLLAAARASGFTLAELAMRSGARRFADGGTTSLSWSGLSGGSGSGGGGIQVQYSPVIHTDNASGVQSALREDKNRLEKWLSEWWDRRKLYDSMVSYR